MTKKTAAEIELRRQWGEKRKRCYLCRAYREEMEWPFAEIHEIIGGVGGRSFHPANLTLLCAACHVHVEERRTVMRVVMAAIKSIEDPAEYDHAVLFGTGPDEKDGLYHWICKAEVQWWADMVRKLRCGQL